jgi:hypothetical protein
MDAEPVGNILQPLRRAQLQLLAFYYAGPGNQEQGLVEADFTSEKLH